MVAVISWMLLDCPPCSFLLFDTCRAICAGTMIVCMPGALEYPRIIAEVLKTPCHNLAQFCIAKSCHSKFHPLQKFPSCGRKCVSMQKITLLQSGMSNASTACVLTNALQESVYEGEREEGVLACRLGFAVLVCSWRRLLADRHSLPFPFLSWSEGPPSRCFGPPFLFLHRWRVASTKTLRIHTERGGGRSPSIKSISVRRAWPRW